MGRQRDIWRKPLFTKHSLWKLKQFWKRNIWFRWVFLILVIGILISGLYFAWPEKTVEIIEKKEVITRIVEKETFIETPTFTITGTEGYIVGNYGNGVQWGGKVLQKVEGNVKINLDAKKLGTVKVHLEGVKLNTEDQTVLKDGDIDIFFTEFEGREDWMGNGIVEGIDLFGNTKKIGKFYPEMHAYLAAFGKAEIRLGKQVAYDELDAIMLFSNGIRRADGKIRNAD